MPRIQTKFTGHIAMKKFMTQKVLISGIFFNYYISGRDLETESKGK
jgi:hypothetical protein